MRESNTTQAAASIISESGAFIETKIESARLQLTEKLSAASGSAVFMLFLAFIALCLLMFLSMGAAYIISGWLRQRFAGFFIVAALYGLLAVAGYLLRRRILILPISNSIIKKMTK